VAKTFTDKAQDITAKLFIETADIFLNNILYRI